MTVTEKLDSVGLNYSRQTSFYLHKFGDIQTYGGFCPYTKQPVVYLFVCFNNNIGWDLLSDIYCVSLVHITSSGADVTN